MKRQLYQWNLYLLVGLAAFQLSGCSETFSPKSVQVSGTVEYNGRPIQHGLIVFSPVNSKAEWIVTADIENGQYLTQAKEGLPDGKYKIVVSAANPDNESQMMSGKYSDLETTNFEITIDNDSNVVKDLKLED